MRFSSVILFFVISSIFVSCGTSRPSVNDKGEFTGRIAISGAFALYPLAVKWKSEFEKKHPKLKIDISAGGAGKGLTDALAGLADIGMVSRELTERELKRGAYGIVVSKDVVIPTINALNPNLSEIQKKGLSKEALEHIFITGDFKNWKDLGFSNSAPLQVFTRSDAAGAAQSWAKFFKKKQEDLQGVAVFGDPGVLDAIKNSKVAIGYNNMAFIYDMKTRKPHHGVVAAPIDLNSNGMIDEEERVYETVDVLSKAIAEGTYPSPPARNLYFVTNNKPTNAVVVAFLQYVLTEGQALVGDAGYVSLAKGDLENEFKKIK